MAMGVRARWVISAALCGALVGGWMGHRRNVLMTDSALRKAEMARVHAAVLEQRLVELKQKEEDLRRELLTASNVIEEVVSDLEAERRANAPLREEIEKRIASEIALTADIENKTKELVEMSKSLQITADEAAKLKRQTESLGAQLSALESARKSLAESEAALREELVVLRKQNTELEAELGKARESARSLSEQLLVAREELGRWRSNAERIEKELAETRAKLEELLSKKEDKEQVTPVGGESVQP